MSWRRDLQFERDVTEHAARGICDPSALIEHAELRAQRLSGEYVTDPMLVADGRDRPMDVREELADARNHLVWWLQANVGHPTVPFKVSALGSIIAAYEMLGREE